MTSVEERKTAAKKSVGLKKAWRKLPHPKTKKGKIAAGVVIVVAVAALKLALGGGSGEPMDMYTPAKAEKRTISQTISGSGALEPANSYTVTTLIQGKVLSADFEEGDTVDTDTVLYKIDSSATTNSIEQAQLSLNQAQRSYSSAEEMRYVKAETAGTVTELTVHAGQSVTAGQTVGKVLDNSVMTLVVPFPADDAQKFYVGQAAAVTLDGSFETLSGTVTAISGSDTVGAGNMITRNVTVSVQNPGGLSNTQRATANVGGLGCAGNGTFTYKSESNLVAAVSGTVTAVNAPEGTAVSGGQTVLTLGGKELENQIAAASDNVKGAQLTVNAAKDQLENYTIQSPIQGTIVTKTYKAGDMLESGKPMCVIYDLSALELTLNVNELDISNVAVGQKVDISAAAVPGETYVGEVTRVSLAGTTTNGFTTYPVTVSLKEYGALKPGMNVSATIHCTTVKDALCVPVNAVSRGNTVLVAQAGALSADGTQVTDATKAESRTVTLGVSDDEYIQILSGLQEGDVVLCQAMISGENGIVSGETEETSATEAVG